MLHIRCKNIRGGVRRSSNLELYRIICMLMIVAHHFVVNSGLTGDPMLENSENGNTLFLYLFGMWGKTGINCFLMITGYFMCTKRITVRKFIKLLLWVYTYRAFIYIAFLFTGYETLGLRRLAQVVMPIWGLNANFTSCFLVFWLTIPFWNILIQNMTKRQHQLLLCLLLGCYTVLGSVPDFDITFNYVTWFGIIYLIASYVRLHPAAVFEKRSLWGMASIASVLMACGSVVVMDRVFGRGQYHFVSDSNRLFAVLVAVSTFLWFKNVKLPYCKVINAIGGSTFGVLCIHANSDAMRRWLWGDVLDCVGHYALPLGELALFSVGAVLGVFFVCTGIDLVRIKLLEQPFFRWYDKRERFVNLAQWIMKW